jgi:hypothetical protein
MIRAMVTSEIKPIWNSSSFLVYTGGLTVLAGAFAALEYLASQYGGAAQAGWALLVLVILYGVAHALRLRDRPIAAGIFAFASVFAWGAFIFYVFAWWGWTVNHNIHEWCWSRIVLELLVLAAAADDHRRFRFPLIRAISVVVFAYFVIDLLTPGGNFAAAIALLVGLLYLAVGNVVDKPSAFWLHLVSGALIGGAFLHWFHTSDWDFAVISIVAFVFVLVAYATKRSSWAVFGTIGFFLATIHYVFGTPAAFVQSQVCSSLPSSTPIPKGILQLACGMTTSSWSPWAPALAFGLLGFWLVGLGMLGRRRRRHAVITEPLAA